mmetsp:Transcript_5440/g.9848  ORF Transcript_5440/g.9848 Transcript_5440/m.9848 type:complete len:157 (-) Transcript_5440:601-1071(-)
MAQEVSSSLKARDEVRTLCPEDYHKGYCGLLSKLATVGDVSENQFVERVKFLQGKEEDYAVFVIEDTTKSTILATGTLLVEYKIIHALGKVGHIEDVVVHPEARGQGLGKRILLHLIAEARTRECYKVILDCAVDNRGFYEKVGMTEKERQMVLYF